MKYVLAILFFCSAMSSCEDRENPDPCSLEKANHAVYNGEVVCFDDQNVKTTYAARAQTFLLDTFLVVNIESLDSGNPFSKTDTVSYQCTIWEGWVTHHLYLNNDSSNIGNLGGVNRLLYLSPVSFYPCYFEGFIEK